MLNIQSAAIVGGPAACGREKERSLVEYEVTR